MHMRKIQSRTWRCPTSGVIFLPLPQSSLNSPIKVGLHGIGALGSGRSRRAIGRTCRPGGFCDRSLGCHVALLPGVDWEALGALRRIAAGKVQLLILPGFRTGVILSSRKFTVPQMHQHINKYGCSDGRRRCGVAERDAESVPHDPGRGPFHATFLLFRPSVT